MPYTNQYDYLIFLDEAFDFSQSFSIQNPSFLFISSIILLYFLLIAYTLHRSKRDFSSNAEPDENMRKILQDYRKEISEVNQHNTTSFISLSTEPHNINTRSGESYILRSNIQETEQKTLAAIEEHTNPTRELDFKDVSMISQNSNNMSIIQEQKLIHDLDHKSSDDSKPFESFEQEKKIIEENKPFEQENKPSEKIEKEAFFKKEEKNMIPPPTFTDRFDIIQNNLAKKEFSPHTLNKSINLDFTINTPEDLNVKTQSYNNQKSPKFEQSRSAGSSKKKKRVRHNVNSKFRQLIKVSNPVYSTFLKESRFFPKHIRITLIYFEVIFCLFLTTLTAINEENSRQKDFVNLIMKSFFASLLSWGVFLCFTMFLTTDKQKLISARNDNDFYSALVSFEKEFKYRTAFGYFIIHILTIMFFLQILAFCTVFNRNIVSVWMFVNGIVLISQHIFLDFVYYFLFSSIYVQAYNSRNFKQIYNFLKSFRVWIV